MRNPPYCFYPSVRSKTRKLVYSKRKIICIDYIRYCCRFDWRQRAGIEPRTHPALETHSTIHWESHFTE